MGKGDRSTAAVKSVYAYGQQGNSELGIGPNTDLNMEVELLDFEKAKEDWGLSFEEKKDASTTRKSEGNDLFQKGHYRHAAKKYKRSLKTFEYEKDLKGDSKDAVQKEIRLPCHLNLAACYTNLKKYKKAHAQADKALEIDPRNVKGLWRRGLAQQGLGDWEDAKKSFELALEVDPANTAVQTSLKKVRAQIAQHDKKQQALYKNLFA